MTLTQSSQSVSGNYSNVRIVWKSTQTGESWNGYTRTAYYYVATNGGGETRYSVSYTLPKGSTVTLVDKTITVSHQSNGKGSISARTYMDTDISAGVIEKSASLTLTTIPRATTVGLSASSADMGASITINTPRADSSFTHDLAYAYGGGSYTTIATGVGTSRAWTVPDLASAVPKATSLTVTVRCITKSGSTSIGTTYATLTAKVPASVVPTVSSVSASEAVSGLAAQFGAFIQGKSKAKVTISASGAKGSTISEYSATLQNKTYTGSSWTSDLLNTAGTLAIKVRVKDTRGRWSDYKTVNISVLAYAKPKVQALRAYRCDASGNALDDGQYCKVEYQYSVTSLNSKNTASMKLYYKRTTAADSAFVQFHTSTALSADTSYYTTTILFSVDYSFDIKLTLVDWFGAEVGAITELPTAKVIMDIRADGLGIGFGKTAELPGVDFGWDIVDVIKNFGTMNGVYKTHDGLLLQWGLVSITPTAADTPTSVLVVYPEAYADTPAVFATLATSVPQNVSVGIQRTASLVPDVKKGIAITLTRNSTTSTGVYWLAIGKGAA
ncbi:MAG: hypothetical protein IKZ08_03080 [Bacteroidales bacterium]|nr:hypothetical protein [Bacteroidales bacterium]